MIYGPNKYSDRQTDRQTLYCGMAVNQQLFLSEKEIFTTTPINMYEYLYIQIGAFVQKLPVLLLTEEELKQSELTDRLPMRTLN